MRHTYELTQKYTGDEESRSIIDNWMNELAKELVCNTNRKDKKHKTKETGTQEESQDPPMPSHRSFPSKRNKPNTKRAVSKHGDCQKRGNKMLLL